MKKFYLLVLSILSLHSQNKNQGPQNSLPASWPISFRSYTGLTWDQDKHKLNIKNPSIDYQDLQLSCQQADISYQKSDQKSLELQYLNCWQALIKSPKFEAAAEQIIFDYNKQIIHFKESVKLYFLPRQNEFWVQGKTASFDIKTTKLNITDRTKLRYGNLILEQENLSLRLKATKSKKIKSSLSFDQIEDLQGGKGLLRLLPQGKQSKSLLLSIPSSTWDHGQIVFKSPLTLTQVADAQNPSSQITIKAGHASYDPKTAKLHIHSAPQKGIIGAFKSK